MRSVFVCLILFTETMAILPSTAVEGEGVLSREILDESLSLGRRFLLNHQKPEGNFDYQVNLLTGDVPDRDNPVRQAGVLWGLSLIHLDDPLPETRDALIEGFQFFERNSRTTENGETFIVYPGDSTGKTGTVALVSLALIEFLRAEQERIDPSDQDRWGKLLDGYLAFLRSLRREDGLFSAYYETKNGQPKGEPSPYFDGEALLALVKAWRYRGEDSLEEAVWDSAESMYRTHVTQALAKDPDSARTKGFFFWGCLSYYELLLADREKGEPFGRRAMELADWMIDVHRTLERKKNTAYAQEGILAAWKCADLLGDTARKEKFEKVIRKGLSKLTTWQVGVSIQNDYLKRVKSVPSAKGGVMNGSSDPVLRLDVTQHQMDAVILARKFLFDSNEREGK